MATKLFVFIFGVFALASAVQEHLKQPRAAARVQFFDHADHNGDNIYVDLDYGVCFNLPAHFNDRASSVNTQGACIHVFEHGNCQGRSKRIAPGTDGHSYLGDDFNDQVTSMNLC